MFVTVLGRIAGVDENQYKNTCTFRDVKKDWAEPYIAWASQNNIVNGIGDNKFGPNNYVTREQAALILFNYLKKDYTLTVSDKFLNNAPDKSNVSSWAVEAMKWATSAALMRGDTGGSLRPRYSATRAEIATIFKRFIEIKTDLDNDKPDVPLGCDHVWEPTEYEKVEILRETVKEWAHADSLDISECNGCNMYLFQWYVDHAHEYNNIAELKSALVALAAKTGCPQSHNGNHSTDNGLPLTFPINSEKVYVAELPVKEVCALCGESNDCVNTKTCKDIAIGEDWIPHTKEIVISEAWDEELYTVGDSLAFGEDGTITQIPAGTLIDTIHHPEYSNPEIEYFENVETGEKIYVEMTGCRHNNWVNDYSSGNLGPDFFYCTDCNAIFNGNPYD